MALILVFRNKYEGSGPLPDEADYEVSVYVGDGTKEGSNLIHMGEHKGHRRSDGWARLVKDYMETVKERGNESTRG